MPDVPVLRLPAHNAIRTQDWDLLVLDLPELHAVLVLDDSRAGIRHGGRHPSLERVCRFEQVVVYRHDRLPYRLRLGAPNLTLAPFALHVPHQQGKVFVFVSHRVLSPLK
jgi:hypothetical protein